MTKNIFGLTHIFFFYRALLTWAFKIGRNFLTRAAKNKRERRITFSFRQYVGQTKTEFMKAPHTNGQKRRKEKPFMVFFLIPG